METFWTPLLILNDLPDASPTNCERQASRLPKLQCLAAEGQTVPNEHGLMDASGIEATLGTHQECTGSG